MVQEQRRHPKEIHGCRECGADPDTWTKKRRLVQIGQTYECSNCGHEVFVYDAGGHNEIIKKWRPVTDTMATNLLFFEEVGGWPDQVLEDMFKQGLERAEAIDYHMVEVEGLTQTEWARRREIKQASVSENVSKAKWKLA